MNYEVILESFEGPLDLLYNLIEKEKVDIYDIPIHKITDQYIDHINSMKELDLEITSEFLIMATTLIEIKSRMLLPKIKKEQDDLEEEDPRDELVRRLLEYKKYKQVSLELKDRESIYKKIYYKAREEIEYYDDELDLEGIDLDSLMNVYQRILENCVDLDGDVDFEEIKRDDITIEESIENIIKILRNNQKMKFENLFDKNTTISIIVTTFLAILELIKQKHIIIEQDHNFSDIFVRRNKL